MHGGSSARFPTKPTEKLKIEKMYAIKQIKICAEYRDMLPRPRLDLSGTPGLRPIGLSPGSWQTSLGLGSMSRYSAQILICISYPFRRPVIVAFNIALLRCLWLGLSIFDCYNILWKRTSLKGILDFYNTTIYCLWWLNGLLSLIFNIIISFLWIYSRHYFLESSPWQTIRQSFVGILWMLENPWAPFY